MHIIRDTLRLTIGGECTPWAGINQVSGPTNLAACVFTVLYLPPRTLADVTKFLVLVLVLAACTAGSEGPTTTEPAVSTTGQTVSDDSGPGFADPPAVETSGDLDPAIDNEIGSLIAAIEAGGFDSEALDAIGAGDDPRVAWFLADLLRFFQGGSEGAQTARIFADLTGVTADTDGRPAFVDAFNHLIAWDLPAWDGYGTRKGELYTILEPAWQPFFDDNISIDWRWVTWGGVLIDDRPLGDPNPCERGCIPALDDPPTVAGDEATWLGADDIVFGVVRNGDALAMPRNQMEVHEMLNLSLGGTRLGIPYCTLCGSAQAYLTESVPDGFETVVLRTSGLLSRSNKVMYDLVTGSVFNTFTGEALSGPLGREGVILEQVTVVTSTWGSWLAEHPDTRVIARDGGLGRSYEPNPLGDRDADGPIFPVGPVDPRLDVHARVVGVVTANGIPIAFPVASAIAALDMGDSVDLSGYEVVADGGGLRVIGPDGEVVAHESFWFAWSQFHPETLLWSGE